MPVTITLKGTGKLESWEYGGLEEYFQKVIEKIEKGRETYGMDYLTRSDASFEDETDAEIADVCGWRAMRFLKQLRMRGENQNRR